MCPEKRRKRCNRGGIGASRYWTNQCRLAADGRNYSRAVRSELILDQAEGVGEYRGQFGADQRWTSQCRLAAEDRHYRRKSEVRLDRTKGIGDQHSQFGAGQRLVG